MQDILESEVHAIAFRQRESLSEMKTPIAAPRLVLADDQEEMLQTIALVLGSEFNIVGTADNGKHAVELATALSPDVLVLDICMPVVNGIEAALRLREIGSHARVVFLTVHRDPDFVEAARSAGALGYVLKDSLAVDLVTAVRTVMRGDIFTSPSMQLHPANAPSPPH